MSLGCQRMSAGVVALTLSEDLEDNAEAPEEERPCPFSGLSAGGAGNGLEA